MELMGSLLAVIFLTEVSSLRPGNHSFNLSEGKRVMARCRVGGLADNKGNGLGTAKLMTTAFPPMALMMELAAQLEARGLLLE